MLRRPSWHTAERPGTNSSHAVDSNDNLVLTGGHMTTAQQLRNCTDILALALAEDQSRPDDFDSCQQVLSVQDLFEVMGTGATPPVIIKRVYIGRVMQRLSLHHTWILASFL
jgi:hypothetical protein